MPIVGFEPPHRAAEPSRVLRRHPVPKDDFRLKRCSETLRGRSMCMSNGIVSLFAALRPRPQSSSTHVYRVEADTRSTQGISPKFCISDPARVTRPGDITRKEDAMRSSNCKRVICVINKRLAEIQLSDP